MVQALNIVIRMMITSFRLFRLCYFGEDGKKRYIKEDD